MNPLLQMRKKQWSELHGNVYHGPSSVRELIYNNISMISHNYINILVVYDHNGQQISNAKQSVYIEGLFAICLTSLVPMSHVRFLRLLTTWQWSKPSQAPLGAGRLTS